jgi:acyl-CoA reductase-like NAD-dependent aldehyde dehydrogenase
MPVPASKHAPVLSAAAPAEVAVHDLVAAARRAQRAWAALTLRERLRVLRRFRHHAARQAETLAQASASSRSRPLAETLTAEVLPLLDACRFLERRAATVLAPRRAGWRGRPLWLTDTAAEVRREPWGVVLLIGPGNYPLLLPGVQALQALAAGNAVVLKPGSGGRPAALALADLLQRAGLDPALCPVLEESPAAAEAALRAGVDKVLLTGSASTGRAVLGRLAETLTPAAVELSGVDAALVRADADPDLAARAVAFGLRLNAGATCIAPRRLVVHRAVAEVFREKLRAALAETEPVPLAPGRLGALTPALQEALRGEARLLAGSVENPDAWRGPLLVEVPAESPLWRADWFVPLALLRVVDDDAAALRVANDSPFALGASIFTRDLPAARALAGELRAGVVTVNDLIVPTADPRLPFGGRGHSGFGVTRGAEGLLELTTPKVVATRRGRWRPHYEPTPAEQVPLLAALLRLLHGGGVADRLRALGDLLRAGRRRPMSTPLPAREKSRDPRLVSAENFRVNLP